MNRTEAREGSAAFVRSLDPDARRIAENPGAKDSDVWQVETWALQMPGDRPRVIIVNIMGQRHPEHSGWMIFAEIGPNNIEGTRRAMLRLRGVEVEPPPVKRPLLSADLATLMRVQVIAEADGIRLSRDLNSLRWCVEHPGQPGAWFGSTGAALRSFNVGAADAQA